MFDDDQVETLDTAIEPQLDTLLETALDAIEDPQEDIVTIEQPALSASPPP
ncbi:MAG: hypothetical protein IPQ07_23925 [Myxococcales bacterium]|nr:hypothetical protein [Myxococcales bacterium]